MKKNDAKLARFVGLLRSTGWGAYIYGASFPIVQAVVGLLRSKYYALALGLGPMGILAQATQLQLLGTSVASMGMNAGIIHALRQATSIEDAKVRRQTQQRVISTAFSAQIIIIIAIALPIIFFSQAFSTFVFGSTEYQFELFIVLLAIPTISFAQCHFGSIIIGNNRYPQFVRVSIYSTVVGFLACIPSVYFYGLRGGVFAILALSVSYFVVFYLAIREEWKLSELFQFKIHPTQLKQLLSFSAALFGTGVLGYLTVLWMRGRFIEILGAEANGIIQVPLAITSYCMPLVTGPMWGKYYPMMSNPKETDSDSILSALIIKTAIISMFAGVNIMCFQETFVRVAYSAEFLKSTALIPYQLIGDYFFFINLALGAYFLARAQLRKYIACWVFFFIGYPLTTVLSIPIYGIASLPMGYVGIGAVACVAVLIWYSLHTRGTIRSHCLLIVVGCFLLLLGQCAITVTYQSPPPRLIIPLFCLVFATGYWAKKHRNLSS